MKICPRCHNQVDNDAKFCSKCGWNFNIKSINNSNKLRKSNYISSERGYRRRWKEQKFEECSFDDVALWLKEHNGHLEIENVRGNMKYDTSGMFIQTLKWHIQYLIIRYYDDSKANKSYGLCYDSAYDKWLSPGKTTVTNSIQTWTSGKNVIFKMHRASHYSGGGNCEFHCGMAIYEI